MSGLVKGLFGGESGAEKQIAKAQPVSFGAPGLSGRFDRIGNRFDVTRSAELETALSNLTRGLENRSSAFRALRERVRPGFGDVTRARVQAIRDAGSRTVGSLRDRLRQRRVLGSSFADREIAGIESQFAQEEERARAEAAIQETVLTSEILDQETRAAIEAAGALVSQFNLESNMAANLSTATQNFLNQNAIAQGQARAASEGGSGSFIGTVLGGLFGGSIFSDRRLKSDIVLLDVVDGIRWYMYRIFGAVMTGVMSDEVPAKYVRDIGGYDAVDYEGLLNGV